MIKKVTISLPPEINERWNKVSKKHDVSKSGMVLSYLEQMLPILEQETPNKMMAKAMKKMADEIETTATLFDNMEHDKSVEEYKKMKLG